MHDLAQCCSTKHCKQRVQHGASYLRRLAGICAVVLGCSFGSLAPSKLVAFAAYPTFTDSLATQAHKQPTDILYQLGIDGGKHEGLYITPFLNYTPETRLAGGLIGITYFQTEPDATHTEPLTSHSSDLPHLKTRPSSISGAFTYTQLQQVLGQLGSELYFNRESVRGIVQANYLYYPDVFFGLGNRSREEHRELFIPQTFTLFTTWLWNLQGKSVRNGVNLGLHYEFRSDRIVQTTPGGLLERIQTLGAVGGQASGVGVVANVDSRDYIFSPTRGVLADVSATVFSPVLGSNFSLVRCTGDVRTYIPLGFAETFDGRQAVLALHGFITKSFGGHVPLFLQARMGGRLMMRGYLLGRFRDTGMGLLQAEVRIPLWWRFGAVAFASAGDMFGQHSPTAFTTETLKYAVGAGIRFTIGMEERLNIRFDAAVGSSGVPKFYFSVLEAF